MQDAAAAPGERVPRSAEDVERDREVGIIPEERAYHDYLDSIQHHLPELAKRQLDDLACSAIDARSRQVARTIGRFLCDAGYPGLWFRAYQVYELEVVVSSGAPFLTPEDAQRFLEQEP